MATFVAVLDSFGLLSTFFGTTDNSTIINSSSRQFDVDFTGLDYDSVICMIMIHVICMIHVIYTSEYN